MCSVFLAAWLLLQLLCVQESFPQTLLLATNSGVKVFSPEVSFPTVVHNFSATAVDFRYERKDVYFISRNQILYSYYSENKGGFAEPIPTLSAEHSLQDLVVDWKSYKFYYSYSGSTPIFEKALLGSSGGQIFSQINLQDLAVDVYERILFMIKDYSLVAFMLQNRQVNQYQVSVDTHDIKRLTKVAVDHHTRELYVLGYDEQKLEWILVSTDYNNTEIRVVYKGPELASPFVLDVFDGEVLWGSVTEGMYTLYICKLSPTCVNQPNIIYQSTEAIHDAKFYNASVQTPSADYACRELNCSHTCTVVTPYRVECSCPLGLVVVPGDHVCREEAPLHNEAPSWTLIAQQVLRRVSEVLLQELSSQTPIIRTFIFVTCVIMLTLLFFGFCFLLCARKPKHRRKRNESFRLRENRYRVSHRRVNR